MRAEKLKKLKLGSLGRGNSTYDVTDKKEPQADGKILTQKKEDKGVAFPGFPDPHQGPSDICKLPHINEVPYSTLRSRNPRRPFGPYAGYFDSQGGFVWIDELGQPFARRPPANYPKRAQVS